MSQVHYFGQEVVRAFGMDPDRLRPAFLSDQGLRRHPGPGTLPVLEARGLASSVGFPSTVSGPVLHGAVPHQPLPTPHSAAATVLRTLPPQVHVSASGGDGGGAGRGSPAHKQNEEGLKCEAQGGRCTVASSYGNNPLVNLHERML